VVGERSESIILDVVCRMMTPIIQIYAFYVIFHGHYSPGGGFQGGALLAGSVLLQRVVLADESHTTFSLKLGIPFGVVGVLIWLGTAVWALLGGGHFLQYDHLTLPMAADMLRNTGILLVEIGVAFAVMGVLVSIFDDLAQGASS
jgi:multicomponent Na+:H+ antiporter subunit B